MTNLEGHLPQKSGSRMLLSTVGLPNYGEWCYKMNLGERRWQRMNTPNCSTSKRKDVLREIRSGVSRDRFGVKKMLAILRTRPP